MKRLVVAPHGDDESLGCGGLLAKHPDQCKVLVLTDSGENRRASFERAMGVLGVEDHRMADYPDRGLLTRPAELVEALDAVLNDWRPDEVYLPYPSPHQDHVATYEAGMRAVRLSMHEDHWTPPSVLIYDVSVYDTALYQTGLLWNVFEELSESHVRLKQAACDCYSDDEGSAHPLLSVAEAAAAAGRPRGLRYAEQYALVREVRR